MLNQRVAWRDGALPPMVLATRGGATGSRSSRRSQNILLRRQYSATFFSNGSYLCATSPMGGQISGSWRSQPAGHTLRAAASGSPSDARVEEIAKLVRLLPPAIQGALRDHPDFAELTEVVLDLGR